MSWLNPAPSTQGKRAATDLAASLIRAIHRMEVHLDGVADSILHGDRLSGFPGRGLEAAGVREYQAGDEARGIDWRVTARKGRLHVREFDEERDLPSLIVMHRSESLRGGRGGIREVRALETGGLLSALALKGGDRAGLLQGGDGHRAFLPPSRRKHQLLGILAGLLDPPPKAQNEPLKGLLELVNRLARERSRIFLIGDFQIQESEEAELRRILTEVGARHALIPVRILDKGEGTFEGRWPLPLQDPRSGKVLFQSPDRGEGGSLRECLDDDEEGVAQLFREVGLREWRVDVGDPLVPTLRASMSRDRVGGGPRV